MPAHKFQKYFFACILCISILYASAMQKVLMLEHDYSILETLSFFLDSLPIQYIATDTIPKALVSLEAIRPDIFIMDVWLGQESLCLVKECQRLYSPIPAIIVISALQGIEKVIGHLPIFSLLKKPFCIESLEAQILNYSNFNAKITKQFAMNNL